MNAPVCPSLCSFVCERLKGDGWLTDPPPFNRIAQPLRDQTDRSAAMFDSHANRGAEREEAALPNAIRCDWQRDDDDGAASVRLSELTDRPPFAAAAPPLHRAHHRRWHQRSCSHCPSTSKRSRRLARGRHRQIRLRCCGGSAPTRASDRHSSRRSWPLIVAPPCPSFTMPAATGHQRSTAAHRSPRGPHRVDRPSASARPPAPLVHR